MTDAQSRFVHCGEIRLHVKIRGEGPDLVILHGFSGSTRSMGAVAKDLSADFRTLSLDLLGHGASEAPDDPGAYTMPRCADQIVQVLDALIPARAHLLGYSMGGRVALALCAMRAERVASAFVIGASAGIEDPTARAVRKRDDDALADRIECGGIPAFVDEWMAQPWFASQRKKLSETALEEARAQRLDNRATGLAHSLRGMGTGAQPALQGALAEARAPICFAVGEHDAKFRRIAAELARRCSGARVEILPGAGHAAHLENPRACVNAARHFFNAVRPGAPRPYRDELSPQPREVTT